MISSSLYPKNQQKAKMPSKIISTNSKASFPHCFIFFPAILRETPNLLHSLLKHNLSLHPSPHLLPPSPPIWKTIALKTPHSDNGKLMKTPKAIKYIFNLILYQK